MGLANTKQNVQDWITQQWVILFGKKISPITHKWLLGPFGSENGIGLKFINQLAEKENLTINNQTKSCGLIQSIEQLKLSEKEKKLLSKNVIDFYENTSNYDLKLKVKWNPLFKIFGVLLQLIFSKRIQQLNVPIKNIKDTSGLTSDIIQLIDLKSKKIKRTVWLRTFQSTGHIVYSGVYETCELPSGKTCIKAVFPLPNGNATVILKPKVGKDGELILDSSGKKIGDSGFYFLLKDSKEKLYTKFIKSFKDKLIVSSSDNNITAIQTLTLWNSTVLRFEYNIKRKEV